MSPSELANQQLALIRREFFADSLDSDFFQQRDFLLQAVAFPAAHLKERYGVSTPDSLSRTILGTVVETIKKHGKKRERFSVYFCTASRRTWRITARNITSRPKPPGALPNRCRPCFPRSGSARPNGRPKSLSPCIAR